MIRPEALKICGEKEAIGLHLTILARSFSRLIYSTPKFIYPYFQSPQTVTNTAYSQWATLLKKKKKKRKTEMSMRRNIFDFMI